MTQNTPPKKQAAWQTVEQWMACVHKQDIDSILLLYDENDSAFWGTFGTHLRKSREEIRTYFDKFLDCESIECRIVEYTARELSSDMVNFTGIYAFRIVKAKGDPCTETVARFTFSLRHDMVTTRWVFVEHHSSLVPESGY